jgi:hypothetical protein
MDSYGISIYEYIIYNIITVKPLSIVSEGTAEKKWWMRENNSCEKVIYMSYVQRPQKVNDTCVKTMNVGTMDRGYTALCTEAFLRDDACKM